ncbi:MAG: hypothetical protein GC136_00155 [Alphaproteobacteria bacterium]|nr:hypothetical protein [Alphaproteobacteria bacterium]
MKPLVALLVLLLFLLPALARADELSMPPEFLGRWWGGNDLCLGNLEITKNGYLNYYQYNRDHFKKLLFLEKYRILHIENNPDYGGNIVYGITTTWIDNKRSAYQFTLQRLQNEDGRNVIFFIVNFTDSTVEDFRNPDRDAIWERFRSSMPDPHRDLSANGIHCIYYESI